MRLTQHLSKYTIQKGEGENELRIENPELNETEEEHILIRCEAFVKHRDDILGKWIA